MPEPKPRRFIPALFRAARRAVLLIGLAGCSVVGTPLHGVPAPDLDPGYARFIADSLKTSFPALATGEGVEISAPQWVQSSAGWSWIACVRFPDRGHRRTYAVFFRGNQIVDSRYAVLTDHCNSQSYSPLDPMGSALRQGVPGDPGPLY